MKFTSGYLDLKVNPVYLDLKVSSGYEYLISGVDIILRNIYLDLKVRPRYLDLKGSYVYKIYQYWISITSNTLLFSRSENKSLISRSKSKSTISDVKVSHGCLDLILKVSVGYLDLKVIP